MVGGHESFGAWSLKKAPALTWSEGDNWVSEDVELPVDGVFVYKYVVTDAQDAGKPEAWQKASTITFAMTGVPLLDKCAGSRTECQWQFSDANSLMGSLMAAQY